VLTYGADPVREHTARIEPSRLAEIPVRVPLNTVEDGNVHVQV
jgi:hypothetical protein